MKTLSGIFLAVIFLGGFLLFPSCKKKSQEGSTAPITNLWDNDESLPYTNTSWMANIPNPKYLNEFTIPGTHDAAADEHTSQQGEEDQYVVAHDYFIYNQMMLGVRWFDIRLNLDVKSGILTAFHGQYYLHKNFNDLLTAGLTFLNNYPTETIIYMIKQENSNESQDEFTQAVYNYLIGRSSSLSLFYMGHAMPTLGQVRGRMVIMTREGCTSAYENKRGMFLTWDDNTGGENIDDCDYPLWVQDHYSINTVPYAVKLTQIQSGISFAQNSGNNRLYLNFTSGERDATLTSIWDVANNINPSIVNYLDSCMTWHHIGVIFVNFAGGSDLKDGNGNRTVNPEFVKLIIQHNDFVEDTIHIGNQVWMRKNLCVTHYRNGDPVVNVTDSTAWSNLTTPAYCSYGNNPGDTSVYGLLYNWYAVNDPRGLCPAGYHIATDSDWTVLVNYLGGQSVAGGKLKITGTSYWKSPNTGATNSYNYSALPGGYRDDNGDFGDLQGGGYWWSSTAADQYTAKGRGIGYTAGDINPLRISKTYGFSVRCVRNP